MITIIVGTNRNNSNSSKVANNYSKALKEKGVEHSILNLRDLPHDFAFTQLGTQSDEYTNLINQYVTNAHKLIIIIPEYNGGFPGVLKSFFDTVPPKCVNDTRCALVGVSSGHSGASRALDSFSDVLHYLKAEVYSNKPKFSGIDGLLDEHGDFINERDLDRINQQIDGLLNF